MHTFSIEFLMDNASNMVSNRPQTHWSQCNYEHRHVPTLCRVEGIGTHLECPQIKVTILSHRIDAAKKALLNTLFESFRSTFNNHFIPTVQLTILFASQYQIKQPTFRLLTVKFIKTSFTRLLYNNQFGLKHKLHRHIFGCSIRFPCGRVSMC